MRIGRSSRHSNAAAATARPASTRKNPEWLALDHSAPTSPASRLPLKMARNHDATVVAFFAILTFGELYILPTGLGLFARLAPPKLGATTVAAWFLVIFSGSLFAGFVGTLWSSLTRPAFFLTRAALAAISAALLFLLDPAARRVETSWRDRTDS